MQPLVGLWFTTRNRKNPPFKPCKCPAAWHILKPEGKHIVSIRPFQIVVALLLLWPGQASAAVFYVDVNSTNPTPPYATWGTASTDIQSAVDLANSGDAVLVTDGVYNTDSVLTSDGTTNQVVLTNAVTLQSVNGSSVTIIDGGGTERCVYLADGAMLMGFT